MFQVVLYLKDEHSMGLDEVYKLLYYSQTNEEDEEIYASKGNERTMTIANLTPPCMLVINQ